MDTFDKNMQQIFDVAAPAEKTYNVEVVPPSTDSTPTALQDDLEQDYKLVRSNYEDIVEMGKKAIEDILNIASNSQHPRAYEVAGTLIKNVTEANEKLIILQKQMREMDKQNKNTPKTSIDKAIFIGSTAELTKMLKGSAE